MDFRGDYVMQCDNIMSRLEEFTEKRIFGSSTKLSLGHFPLLKLEPGLKCYWIKPCSPMNFSLSCQYEMLSKGLTIETSDEGACCGWVNQLDKDRLSSSLDNCAQLPAILGSHLLSKSFKWTQVLFWSRKTRISKRQQLVFFLFCFNADLLSSHRLKTLFRLQ